MTKRHELADCENCSLNVPGTAFIPSVIPEDVEVVLVGEAPGYGDRRAGKPFTGPSGKLLDAVLSSNGVERRTTMVTNVCLCRDANNSPVTKSEIACCSGRLSGEIEASGARTIVALGGPASSAIAGRAVKITEQRTGPARESELYPGKKFISTFHPAYLMRSQDAFPQFVDDIKKINTEFVSTWKPPQYLVVDDEVTTLNVLDELWHYILGKESSRLVIDIEVGIDKEVSFGHPEQYQMLCIGIGYAKGKVLMIGEKACKSSLVRSWLKALLEDPRARITAHNGKFDLAGLKPLGINAKLSFDTMLASYALDERAGTHGLKYLAVEKLGAPQYDIEIHKYLPSKTSSYALVPRDILYKYCAYDVSCTWDLQDLQEIELAGQPELQRLVSHLVSASGMLQHAEEKGISVDMDYLGSLHIQYEESMEAIKRDLHKWVDNPNSPKQVKEALAALGKDVKGTDVDILTDLLAKATGDLKQFLQLMLVWRKEAKLYGTYIKGISERVYNGRIHPSFLLHGTTTGRLACRNPNLQNVPRDSTIRNMYIPAPGNIFVQADYKTAELRVVATLAHDEVLADMLGPGKDIHSEVALRFFGEGFSKDQRVRAKAVVFGLTYGRTAFDLAQEYDMAINDAQTYLNIWFDTIPATVAWREEIMKQVTESEEDLVSHFGRHRRFWLITDENIKDIKKESLAFLPQGIASDINLSAATRLYEQGLDVRLLVHDSILIECKIEEADKVAEQMSRVMTQTAKDVFTDFVEFPVDVSIGYRWGEL